jgi:hypothetical protein
MTDLYTINKKEELNGEFIISITLNSKVNSDWTEEYSEELLKNMTGHTRFQSSTGEIMVFDHDPTHEDILEKATEYGHEFSVDKKVKQDFAYGNLADTRPIVTKTEGEEDTVEYTRNLHPDEFTALYNQVPVVIDLLPTSICKKGKLFYLYYVERLKPTQWFNDSETFFLYSVRIHEDTEEIKRKGYNKGNPNNLPEHRDILGERPIIAAGEYLDENAITLYYPKTLGEEVDPAIVDKPYLGSHFKDDILIYTREYKHDDI